MAARIDEFGTPDGLQPLRRRLGARDGHARTSGRSRSPRTGAARATARSCTGPAGISAQGRGALAVPPRDRRRADGARGGGPARSRRSSTASQQQPIEGVEHALLVRRRGRGRAPHDAVLRDVLQPRHLPRGLDRGHPPLARPGSMGPLPAFDDDVWELYDTTTTGARRTTWRPSMPEKLRRAAASCGSRRRASTTCCRSTTAGSSASTPTSPGGRR